MAVYDGPPADMVHTLLRDVRHLPNGDPAKMVKIMIESVDQNPALKRIARGSDSYTAFHKAMIERFEALEAQKDLAFSTDSPQNASLKEAASVQSLRFQSVGRHRDARSVLASLQLAFDDAPHRDAAFQSIRGKEACQIHKIELRAR